MQQYPFVLPDPGVKSADEADEIIALYESPGALSAEDHEEIEKIRSQLGKRFCHRCGYCMPCDQGVEIPGVMGFRSISQRFSRSMTIAFTKDAMETVDNCTECGECLEKCPYNLPIPELIREHRTLFNAYMDQQG